MRRGKRNASRRTSRAHEAQRPQQAPTPSRSRNSRIELEPSATVSWISFSVTALQMQTYIDDHLAVRAGACARRPIRNRNENDYHLIAVQRQAFSPADVSNK